MEKCLNGIIIVIGLITVMSGVLGVLEFHNDPLGRIMNKWFVLAIFGAISLPIVGLCSNYLVKEEELRIAREDYSYYVDNKKIDPYALDIDNYTVEYDDQNKTAKLTLKEVKDDSDSNLPYVMVTFVVAMLIGTILFKGSSNASDD